MLDDKSILITGGTGSFGKRFIKTVFDRYKPKEQQKVYILTAKTEENPTLSLPLVKRRSAKKA